MDRRRESEDSFSLSFIDVMACGLGAVVLLLVVLNFKISPPAAPSEVVPAQPVSEVKAQSDRLIRDVNEASKEESALADRVADLELVRVENEIKLEALAKEVDVLREKASNIPELSPVVVEKGESLFGLKVVGSRVMIYLDLSSSMISEQVVDAIMYNSGGLDLSQSAKWKRAKKIARWIADRAPGNVGVRGFNEKVHRITRGVTDASQAVSEFDDSIGKVDFGGGSSFDEVFDDISGGGLDQVFIITDGLPTKGATGFGAIRSLSACGVRRRGIVSGDCRLAIFAQALRKLPPGVRIDIVLLPLEGEPFAVEPFWKLASKTGGMLFAPAEDWP